MNNAKTWSATVGGHPVRLTVELDAEGKPVDLSTAGCGLPGSALDGIWRCFVKTWDLNLKSGKVPVEELLTFIGRRDEGSGKTGDQLVDECGGLADYFARSYLVRIGRADLLLGEETSPDRRAS